MNREALEAALPHRPPMLLVDEITACDEDRITCQKTFREEEFFVQGHYPGFPLVPGVILCEAAMQAGGVLLSRQVDAGAGVPVATRMNNVRFRRMVRPGDTITLDVQLRERLANAYFLEARVRCRSKTVAQFEFACALAQVQADE